MNTKAHLVGRDGTEVVLDVQSSVYSQGYLVSVDGVREDTGEEVRLEVGQDGRLYDVNDRTWWWAWAHGEYRVEVEHRPTGRLYVVNTEGPAVLTLETAKRVGIRAITQVVRDHGHRAQDLAALALWGPTD